MSFYLGMATAILAPMVVLAAALAAVSARDRRLVRTAVSLADRRIAVLSARKARALEKALVSFLTGPLGAAVAEDPRITDRLHLFWSVRASRRAGTPLPLRHLAVARQSGTSPSRRRRSAEAALGLAPLHTAV